MESVRGQNKHYQILTRMFFGLLVFGFGLFPLISQGATISFSSATEKIYKDDIFVVETRISSPDEFINAAESTLLFDTNKLEVKELSTGGSLFSVWLKPPIFSNENGKISFIGGTPDGFQGRDALILKIIFLAKNSGEAKLDFQDDTALFLHNGKGTKIRPWLRPLSLNILKRPSEITAKNEWQLVIQEDKTPPEPFEINLSKDQALFDNQYFISFFAVDKKSGIDHYEVQEGTKPYVAADSPYLLKDQKLRSVIRVKAIDKAGNERIVEMPAPHPPVPPYKTFIFWITVGIVLAVIIIVAWIILINRKKIQSE